MSKLTTTQINGRCEYYRKWLLEETHSQGWHSWHGEFPPPNSSEPVQIWWPNGIIRTYEKAEYIAWKNLPIDNSVKWRRP